MKIKPVLFYLTALLASHSFSDTYILDHLLGSVLVSRVLPSGKLADVVRPAMSYGVKLHSPYYKYLNCHVILNYSHLSSGSKSRLSREIHYLHGGLGIGFKTDYTFLPETGIGVDLSLIRSDNPGQNPSLLMDDNESEYGMYPFVSWKIPFAGNWHLSLDALWSIVFSHPYYGHLPRAGIGVGKTLW